MKLVVVQGTLGSGKTSLIRRLIERYVVQDQRASVLVNENGEVGYDQDFLARHHVRLERLRGG